MCNSISISAYKARARSLAAAKASGRMKPKFKGESVSFRQGLKVLSEAAVAVQEQRSSLSSKYDKEKATEGPSQIGQQQRNVRALSRDECEEILDNIFRDMDSSFFFTPKMGSLTAMKNPTRAPPSQARKLTHNNVSSASKSKCRLMNHETKSVHFVPMYATSTISFQRMQV